MKPLEVGVKDAGTRVDHAFLSVHDDLQSHLWRYTYSTPCLLGNGLPPDVLLYISVARVCLLWNLTSKIYSNGIIRGQSTSPNFKSDHVK